MPLFSTCYEDYNDFLPQITNKLNILDKLQDQMIQKAFPNPKEVTDTRFAIGDPVKMGTYYQNMEIIYETYNFLQVFLNTPLSSERNRTVGSLKICKDYLNIAAYAHHKYGKPQESLDIFVVNVTGDDASNLSDYENAFSNNNAVSRQFTKMIDLFIFKGDAKSLDDIQIREVAIVDNKFVLRERGKFDVSLKDFIVQYISSIDVMIQLAGQLLMQDFTPYVIGEGTVVDTKNTGAETRNTGVDAKPLTNNAGVGTDPAVGPEGESAAAPMQETAAVAAAAAVVATEQQEPSDPPIPVPTEEPSAPPMPETTAVAAAAAVVATEQKEPSAPPLLETAEAPKPEEPSAPPQEREVHNSAQRERGKRPDRTTAIAAAAATVARNSLG
jgi:hypothetical protein